MPDSSLEKETDSIPGGGSATTGGRAGLVYGLSAYTLWGVFPMYFTALAHVPPLTVLCHRVVWSALFLTTSMTRQAEAYGPIGVVFALFTGLLVYWVVLLGSTLLAGVLR